MISVVDDKSNGKYDFAFDQMVDGIAVGAVTGGMRLRVLTVATDATDKIDIKLMAQSQGKDIFGKREDLMMSRAERLGNGSSKRVC